MKFADRCSSNPCTNDGTCISNSAETYSCHCHPGFYGINCEISKCYWQLLVGEEVINSKLSIYVYRLIDADVVCFSDYLLILTELVKFADRCSSNPCTNDGTCISNSAETYSCHCHPGFYSINCEISKCYWQLLVGEEVINSKLSIYVYRLIDADVVCFSDYLLILTELVKFADRCSSNPCTNDGTCISNSAETYSCHCHPGFYGINCEISKCYWQLLVC